MFNQGIYSKSSGGGGTGQGITGVVANYSALPSVAAAADLFYFVENSQGTYWLPGKLGGTYYPAGIYYSNGVTWFYAESPYQASQADVNAGLITDQFVSPATLANSTLLSSKLTKCHTLHFEHTQLGSGTASTAFIFAAPQATANTTGGALRRLPVGITGHIYTVTVHSTIQTALAGSAQQATLKIYNVNAGTNVTVGATIQYDAVGQSYVYTLATPFAVTAGDDLYCEITFPAWSSTVPAGIIHYIDALIYGF